MMFTDQFGNLPPQGTVVRVPSLANHTGLIAYNEFSQQVVLHNSKARGRAAVTTPEEFNNKTLPIVFEQPFPSPSQGALAVQRACADVQRGVRWTLFDNCQD